MNTICHDQRIQPFGKTECIGIGDSRSPIVAEQRKGLVWTQMIGKCSDILHQIARLISLDTGWFERFGKSALVGRNDVIILCKQGHEVAPGAPILRKAVQAQDQRF